MNGAFSFSHNAVLISVYGVVVAAANLGRGGDRRGLPSHPTATSVDCGTLGNGRVY